MNHIYNSIWNKATGAYAAVSEHVKAAGKRSMPGASGGGAHFALTSMAAALMLGYGSLALAGPTGGTVVAGQAQVNGTPGATVVNQASQNAVINWSTFNVGKGESVQFVQPNSNAVALNRVLGSDATTILGNVSANGKVFIVNPNGILFGQGSSVNTAGLVASTLDISNADFMAGRYKFSGNSSGKVLNQGDLAAPGGYVALLGAHVSNEGTINARLGTVALAAGQAMTLDVAGDGLLNVAVDQGAVGALVQNGGLVQADGGAVILTAQAAGNLLKTVVNNTGVIEARSIDTRGGTIKLLGDMQSGTVNAAGTLDASAPAGNGGNGGFIETSAAHVKLADDLNVTTAAARGLTGTWLIDPTDFTIAATGGDQTGAFYTNALKTSNVTIQTVATGAGAGDINVNDNIVWNANKLTLTAHNNININRALRGAGTASLALEYGQANAAAGNTSTYNVKAEVDLPSGQNFSTRLGNNGVARVYTVLNSLGAAGSTTGSDLQGMSLTGSYVLGSNLDISASAAWNSNTGFMPIGSAGSPFTGTFDGLGHELHGLTINRDAPAAGLFGEIGASGAVRNLGLVNVNIAGGAASYSSYANIGALAGVNRGRIDNVYSSGQVSGSAYGNVGGLVGTNSGIISNSHTGGAMTSASYAAVGGLVSVNAAGGLITDSYSTTAVTTSIGAAAGLVGNNLGAISNSYATGNISSGSNYGAGLVSSSSGSITNSHATGNVSGVTGLGGLVGYLDTDATIDNSYATGKVTSTGSVVGGLVGLSRSAVRNSYATGDISGTSLVGGVVGYNMGSITNAYHSGKNSGTSTPGGIVGDNNHGSIVNAFFNQDLNPGMTGVGRTFNNGTSNAVGLTAAQMLVPANYAGFTFTTTAGATGNNWVLVGSNGALNGSGGTRPMLAAEWSTTINSPHQLQLMAMNQGASYTLGSSFSAAGTAANAADVWANSGFIPVGTAASPFVGKLDGAGHIISNLRIAKSGVAEVGLFGAVGAAGAITNVGLSGSNVTGSSNVGALAGRNAGFISGSFANGDVVGDLNGGGLVGNNTGTISDSYASGSVGGNNTMAGLVGNNSGTINNSYANASVGGSSNVGGLVAVNSGVVAGSFWDTSASGSATSAGGSGLTTAQLTNLANYTGANWELGQMWVVYDGQSAPFLRSFMQPIAVRVSYDTKVYDGAAYAGGANTTSLSNVVSGNTLSGAPVFAGSAAGAVNAGTYAVSVSGYYATGGQSAYAISYIDGGLVITPRLLTLTGATAGNKVYDGTTAAVLGGGTLSGVLAGDNGNVALGSLTGAYASKNVDNAIAVNATATIIGSAGGNYALAPLTGVTGNITPATITTVDGIVASSKTYDGTTSAALSTTAAVFNGRIGSDVLSLTGTAAFADKNVGTGKTISISGLSLGGADAANYTLQTTTASGVGDIAARALTLTGVSGVNRAYDGTTTAGISGGTLSGFIGSETVTLAGLSGTFADKNVGNAKAITVSNAMLVDGANGGLASNYTVATPAGLSANVTQAIISSISNITTLDKVYNGSTAAALSTSGATFNGMMLGDSLALNATTTTFANKNVGNGKSVAVSGITLGGADAGNYTLTSTTASTTGNITPKALTITGMSAVNKVYNGTTNASLSGGAINGLVGSETLGVTGLTASFADKNAGIGKTVTATGSTLVNGGNGGLAANYTISNPTGLTATITPKALTVSGMTAATRAYDGSTAASLTGGALSGLVGVETLVLLGGSGNFADKNAGNGKAVTVSGLSLADGSGLASNYSVINPTGITGSITQKVLGVTGALAQDKTYDGTTAATITGGVLTGMIGTETLAWSGLFGKFADRNAGSDKTVNLSGSILTDGANGGLANNYTLGPVTSLRASIAQKALTVTGVTAASKVYDGSTSATLSGGTLSGLVGSETLNLSGLAGTFADKNAGSGKAVTVNGATLGDGTGLASNYTVANPIGVSADINKATISAVTGITAGSKVYDGTTAATIDTGDALFAGMVAGDSLTASASGAFADKNAGAAKAVNVSGIALGGADAANYDLASRTARTTADIGRATIDAVTGITAANKVYDGASNAALNLGSATFVGQVAGDALVLGAPVTGTFSDKNAANGKTVTIDGLALGGADAGNYILASNQARTTADITPASLMVTATGVNRVYDATTNASVTLRDNRIAGDVLSISNTGASFASKNAAVNKTVTVAGIAIGGADAGNYVANTMATTTANITQAALEVRVANVEKDQGRANPAFAASYTGLLGADTTAGEVGGTLAFNTDASTGSAAGSYLVSAGGQTAANYTLTYTPGVLTVKPTEALQSALSNVIGTVAMAPSMGNMVHTEMATTIATTGDAATAQPDAASTTAPAATSAGTAPVVQAGASVNTNVLPGLRLSVVDTGLRLPDGAGENTSAERQ